jgi:hypothetical protein
MAINVNDVLYGSSTDPVYLGGSWDPSLGYPSDVNHGKIVLRGDRVRQLIPKNIPVSQTEDFVCKALEHYNKFLRNRAERDSR